VGDHHGCLPQFVGGRPQHLQHLPGRPAVQRPGRLVGEQHGRLRHKGPRDGDSLLLSARQGRRQVLGSLFEPYPV
jgi:hypothetical protein